MKVRIAMGASLGAAWRDAATWSRAVEAEGVRLVYVIVAVAIAEAKWTSLRALPNEVEPTSRWRLNRKREGLGTGRQLRGSRGLKEMQGTRTP